MAQDLSRRQSALRRAYTRRAIVLRSAMLGVSASAVSLLLAACGGDDEAPPPTATTGTSGSQPTQPTATTATAPAAATPTPAQATPTSAVGSAASDAPLRIGLSVDINTLDPHAFRGTIDLLVDDLIYDTLIVLDPETGEIKPRLATAWEIVDPTTLRFRLRSGVTFSDGTPLDAEVVRQSFERNREAFQGKSYYGTMAGISAVDPSTVEFKLSRPHAPFLYNLAIPVGGVLAPKIVQKNAIEGVADVVGSGPFILTKWTLKEELTLEPNDRYWGQKPKLTGVTMKIVTDASTRLLALRAGEVDAILNPPTTEIANLSNDAKFDVPITPQSRIVWIGFNFQNELLGSNLALRQAIAHGIDAKAIVELGLEGVPRLADAGPIPPEILPTEPPVKISYDPNRAKQFLAEAGYADGVKVELWTPSGRYFGDQTIAEVAQQQLQQIGIETELKVLEWGTLQAAYQNHEQQVFVLGWGFTGHPGNALGLIFTTGSVLNWSGYSNPTMDEKLVAASAIFDRQEQIKAYSEISKMIIDDVVMVPIYYAVNVWATTNKVHDIVYHPNETISLTNAWVEK